ncbi:MAG: response regulator transcription factor [Rhodanobacteraceae bacterium]
MKLLLVEDNERLRTTLARGLDAEGFAVDVAADGAQALQFLKAYEYELLVLDLMLPKLDGLGVLRELAVKSMRPRVLVLSARDQVADRIEALDAGADDYLVKPFAFDEVLARLHALARRPIQAQAPELEHGPLRIDVRAKQVRVGNDVLALTAREYALLVLLVRHQGRVFSRMQIQDKISDSDNLASDRGIEVLVHGLRRKLEQAGVPELIKNRRGAGYLIP